MSDKAQVVTFIGNTVCMKELDFDTLMNNSYENKQAIDKLVEALSKATRVIRDLNNHVCVDDIDDVIADLSLLIKSISSKGVKGE